MIDLLKKYDREYDAGNPLISDTEYDLLKRDCKKRYPDDPYFKSIGCAVGTKEVKLPYLLGSLDKVGPDEVESWVDDNQFINDCIVAEEKLDGCTIFVKWENGKPVFGATRGNGSVGQDISNKLKYFIPEIKEKGIVELRGEATLMNDSHHVLKYKNRRNGVAGLLRRDDINEEHLKLIVPKFYEVLSAPSLPKTELLRLEYIINLGLQIPLIKIYDGVNNINEHIKNVKRDNVYDIDGVVLVVNNSQRQNVMIPSNKIAYKVNEDAVKVTVTDIEWNLSKGGKMIPTILIEPVEISGSTVSRTTGFNAQYVYDNEIGKGAILGLVKSGEIIPYVVDIFKKAAVILPEYCPDCGCPLVWKGVDIVCLDDECLLSNSKRIAYFFKKLDCDYITETTIDNLGIKSIEDMYELNELDFLNIDGFGIKKGEQITNEVQKTLYTSPEKLIAAFSIPGVGVEIATKIMTCVSTFDEIFSLTYDRLFDTIGEKTAEKFINNIDKYESLYKFLLSKGLNFKEKPIGDFTGKLFALTGTGTIKRDQLIKMIQAKGGSVNTVSQKTDYLVAEDPDGTSGKLQKARKYGTKIIGYDELMKMLGA